MNLPNYHFKYGFTKSEFLWEVSSEIAEDRDNGTKLQEVSIPVINDPDNPQSVQKKFMKYCFDAVPSEGHTAQSIVTKFPMSTGFIVSDHMIKQNRVLKLKVVASNMVNNELWELISYAGDTIAGSVLDFKYATLIGSATSLVRTTFESANRVSYAFDLFNKLMAQGTRLYVNTILGPYSNCVVTSIEVVQDKETSAILAAEITLEELQVVNQTTQDKAVMKQLSDDVDYSKFIKLAISTGVFLSGRLLNKLI